MYMQIPPFANIIPVKDKKPLMPWKEFTERKQTAEEKLAIRKRGDQLGIVTGKVSNLLVLDDDGGLTNTPPLTWTQTTPRGKHYFFKWTKELDKKITTRIGVENKLDIRGDGGFAVFYGFDRPITSTPLALPPQWLINSLPNKEDPKQLVVYNDNPWLLDQLNNIKPGEGSQGRTPTFVRVIGQLKFRGFTESEICGMLSPWAEKYQYTELNGLIKDQFKRYPPTVTNNTSGMSIDQFLENTETVEWIVPGLVARRSIGFIAGLPETGKTWMLIDLAIECARGDGKWLGKFPAKKAIILFIDQERFKGETQRRFQAVINAKGYSPKELKDRLLVRCGTTTRLNLQNSFDAFRKELSEVRPDVVIFDSFATAHTCEENNRQAIQVVLEKVKELRSEFGCTFLFIHHESKIAFLKGDEAGEPSISHMAGSVAIPAAAELVLTVRKHDAESSMVYHTKSTLSSTIEPFLVKVSDVDPEKTMIKVEGF